MSGSNTTYQGYAPPQGGDYAHRTQPGIQLPSNQQQQFTNQATQPAHPDWQQPSTGSQPYAPPSGPAMQGDYSNRGSQEPIKTPSSDCQKEPGRPQQDWQQAQPAPVAQGYPQGPQSTVPVLYAPADLGPPLYLGTALRLPMRLNCGICGFQGDPAITARIGCAWWMGIMMSFGLILLCPGWGKDTYVVCPQCKKEVGVAKLM